KRGSARHADGVERERTGRRREMEGGRRAHAASSRDTLLSGADRAHDDVADPGRPRGLRASTSSKSAKRRSRGAPDGRAEAELVGRALQVASYPSRSRSARPRTNEKLGSTL